MLLPLYDLKCPNGHTFEVLCHPDKREFCACPECQATGGTPIPSMPRRERHFAGRESESIMYGFHGVGEVPKAREQFADTGATITDDGRVLFDKRSTEEKFTKRWRQVKG